MGFGLLFIGYFFLLFFPLASLDVLPNLSVIGCLLMFSGIRRLIHYCADCRGFVYAKYALIVLSALAIACLGLDIAELDAALSDGIAKNFAKPLAVASEVTIGVFSILLMLGIHKLATDVKLPKISAGAVRHITALSVFVLLTLISGIGGILAPDTTSTQLITLLNTSDFFAFILEYICLIWNLAFIYSCYMRICLEGDEDMPAREDLFDKIIAWTKRNR